MRKNFIIFVTIVCLLSFVTISKAEIKTDFASTTIDISGTERGMKEARDNTTNIKTYGTDETETPIKEIGFWTAAFFIIIVFLKFFVAR